MWLEKQEEGSFLRQLNQSYELNSGKGLKSLAGEKDTWALHTFWSTEDKPEQLFKITINRSLLLANTNKETFWEPVILEVPELKTENWIV